MTTKTENFTLPKSDMFMVAARFKDVELFFTINPEDIHDDALLMRCAIRLRDCIVQELKKKDQSDGPNLV